MSPAERFEVLYRTHYPAVLRFARRRTDHATAEDVAAETFAVAWRRLEKVPDDPLPWLYVVAGHELANWRRAATSEREKTDSVARDVSRDPAEALAERDTILRAFAELSERDREALRLVAWEGLSLADGARVACTTRHATSTPHRPDDLLHALLATSRPKPRRRRRKLVLVPAAAITGAAALLVLLPGGSPDLAARAYAQTAPASDSILYVHTTTTLSQRAPGDNTDNVSSSARWQQGERWHAITHFGKDEVVEEIRGADGVLHFSDGVSARREDGGDAKQYIDRRATGFLAEFRSDYERGRLGDGGETTFNGRPAKRYVVDWKVGESRAEYFLDADTGMPLGSRQSGGLYRAEIGPDGRLKPGPKFGTSTAVTTVDALEQLPSTPENEKKLSG